MYGGRASDGGDVVLGWLTRVVVILSLVAVVVFDTLSIASARLGLADDANAAAQAANYAWVQMNGNAQAAQDAAVDYAEARGEQLSPTSFSISSAGVVRLTLERRANTLVVGRLGPLKRLAETTAQGSASTPAS